MKWVIKYLNDSEWNYVEKDGEDDWDCCHRVDAIEFNSKKEGEEWMAGIDFNDEAVELVREGEPEIEIYTPSVRRINL